MSTAKAQSLLRLSGPLLLLAQLLGCGCAARTPSQAPPPAPRSGGTLRLAGSSEIPVSTLLRVNVALPLAGRRSPARLDPQPGSGDRCWQLRSAAAPAIAAAEVRRSWERGLRDPATFHRVALEHLVELDDESGLRICFSRPTRDLRERLSHPDLWIDGDPAGEGAGGFRRQGDSTWIAAAGKATGRPRLDRVQVVPAGSGDAALLLRLEQADLAIVYERVAQSLLSDTPPRIRLERLPAWDRVWYLRVRTSRRWVNDPNFRRWLAGAIDRSAMNETLFSSRGEPAWSLSVRSEPGPFWEPVARRPFSPPTRPRLVLETLEGDPQAERIASRLRAELDLVGVSLEVRRRDARDLLAAEFASDADLALIVHQPPVADPVLGLWDSVRRLGAEGADAATLLDQAVGPQRAAERAAAAWLAESALLYELRVIPLVRVHAWLALDRELRDVYAGPFGVLDLTRAWWDR